jgi:putative phage-type endonuclease
VITEQQREERRLGIGGSDMPIIMGLSSYKTPYQLYLEKVGEVTQPDDMTELQYWGNQLEGIVRDEFAKRNNVIVETPETLVHPFHTFLRANIDGFIPSLNAILEVKCSSSFMSHEWGEDGGDVIPMQYLVQVAHYCAVKNSDCAYIAVLIGGNDYREFKYTRDMDIENKIIEEAQKFWKCVQDRTPPEPINQFDLRLMYPKHDPEKTKTINTPVAEQLTTLSETRFKIKQLSEIEEKYKFNIMQFMKDAECLVDGEGKPIVSWKANKRGSRTFLLKGMTQC